MTVLVTGASGFLGGRLVQLLCEHGEEVSVLVRRPELPSHLSSLPLKVVQGDLNSPEALKKAVAGVSVIYHCAGLATDWAPWAEFERTNIMGVGNLLTAASEVKGLSRFVHVSSTDVYGYPRIPCGEVGPLVDVGLPYNRSKILGEKEVRTISDRTGLAVTIIRPPTIYGPRSPFFAVELAKLLAQNMMMYVRGGHTMGGFVYVDDVAQGIMKAAGSRAGIGQAYNIGPEVDVSWRGFSERLAQALGHRKPWLSLPYSLSIGVGAAAEVVNKMFGIKSRPLLSRMAVYVFSRAQNFPIDKAKTEIGYTPSTDIEEGIRRTVEWLKRDYNPSSSS